MNRLTMLALAALLAALGAGVHAQDSRSANPQQTQPGEQTGQPQSGIMQGIMMSPKEMTWTDAPASLPSGAKMVALEGDPMAAGKPYTARLRLPRGHKIPAHWHGSEERVTVISGEFALGHGETWDDSKLHNFPAGSFILLPAGERHFTQARRETMLQLHGMGPWSITYVNPTDDPRGVSKKGR